MATPAEACPVIHKVTTHDGDNVSNNAAECPVKIRPETKDELASAAKSNAIALTLRDVDIDAIDETPSVLEFKKLRKVMGQITSFYRSGSEMKQRNVAAVDAELVKMQVDEAMVAAQLAALKPDPAAEQIRAAQFRAHPKRRDYENSLLAEQSKMAELRAQYLVKRAEGEELFDWSLGVVECCEWLEQFLCYYCKQKLVLPQRLADAINEPAPLSDEKRIKYARALDEITYNLAESQDFFQASVDGRLKQYHQIELDIITAQMKALEAFPEDSPRRQYIMNELDQDLQYLGENMKDTPDVMKRRHMMLTNHKDFFKTLKYPREKLAVLLLDADAMLDRKYDSKYDLYPATETIPDDDE